MSIKKCGNNAGLTLVELLVALAVSTLVIVATMVLLTNGITSYRRQTVTAQLQQDADLALTHISDAILEAEVIDVGMNESATGSTNTFYVKKDQAYGYKFDYEKKILYVVTKDSEGNPVDSVLCSNVEYFKVQMLKSSVQVGLKEGDTTESITGLNDIIQIKVNIKTADGDISRTAARVSGVRNDIELSDVKLVGLKADEFLDYENLVDYGFLVEE